MLPGGRAGGQSGVERGGHGGSPRGNAGRRGHRRVARQDGSGCDSGGSQEICGGARSWLRRSTSRPRRPRARRFIARASSMPPDSAGAASAGTRRRSGRESRGPAGTIHRDHPLRPARHRCRSPGTIAQESMRQSLVFRPRSVGEVADDGVGEQPAAVGEHGAAGGVRGRLEQPPGDGVGGPRPAGVGQPRPAAARRAAAGRASPSPAPGRRRRAARRPAAGLSPRASRSA